MNDGTHNSPTIDGHSHSFNAVIELAMPIRKFGCSCGAVKVETFEEKRTRVGCVYELISVEVAFPPRRSA